MSNDKAGEIQAKIIAEQKAKEVEKKNAIADSLQKANAEKQKQLADARAKEEARINAITDSLQKVSAEKQRILDEQRAIEKAKNLEKQKQEAQERKLKELLASKQQNQLQEAKEQIDVVNDLNISKIYNDERTEEHAERPRVKITRIIINKKGIITVYVKAEHAYGETFFFEDNHDISETYYNLQTK